MITYLIIGLIYSFLMNLMLYNQQKQGIDIEQFTIAESIFVTLFWPIYLIYLIITLLNNKE